MQQLVDSRKRDGDLARGARIPPRHLAGFQLRHGAMTLSELAETNGVDAPCATLIVDTLEAHCLVQRHPLRDDRRRKLVTLTTAGREAIATSDAVLLRSPRAVGSLHSEEVQHPIQPLGRTISSGEPDDPSRQ
jgi:hypothetical protein